MIKVAFSVFGGTGWTGGINYLRNLLSAIAELPGKPVEPVLFIAPDTPESSIALLRPYLAKPPVVVAGWSAGRAARLYRLAGSSLLQRDFISEGAFRQEGIDVVFQHAAWYGLAFPIPTLAWIADFQHKHLPKMFAATNNLKRDLGYRALSYSATGVMLSSQDALRDCEAFFPGTRGKTSVLPFCVQLPDQTSGIDPAETSRIYKLPTRYFYLPNQFWKHKNHLGLLASLKVLRDSSREIVVVASGNPADVRNPDHPAKILETMTRDGLVDSFRFLGLIPYEHIMPLMRGSLAVINPSLFEGWSTTVEEAKAIGVPLLLSDIGVHREQAENTAQFFDPHDPVAMADCLHAAWTTMDRAQRPDLEAAAIARYRIKRAEFAANFSRILEQTLST